MFSVYAHISQAEPGQKQLGKGTDYLTSSTVNC